ncbi:hypothetical protein [uncultured Bifidobacterium sp.]|nr:hypothetical protein [uncultured Bifidobacterium sp.]
MTRWTAGRSGTVGSGLGLLRGRVSVAARHGRFGVRDDGASVAVIG